MARTTPADVTAERSLDAPAVNRRDFAVTALGGVLLAAATPGARAQSSPQPLPRPRMMQQSDVAPLKVAMLVYPRMVMLDLVAPQSVLQMLNSDIHLVGETREPVATDLGLPVTPTCTIDECPRDLDVLFVPGGLMGSVACMKNPAILDFLADRGSRSRYVTSVCTGGLVLAAAGLLRGYEATAHWAVTDLLPLMGATKVDARVVHDRNRLTGAGVTAGLDFGLTLAVLLRGQEAAERTQLVLEYEPAPPFHKGTPILAGPERVAQMRTGRVWMDGQARDAALAAAKRLGL
ncbi:cyclohexyl-isocyanide hydratase [Methylobacterium sp. ap11]|jgi:cyclohexyl-isocyanide hydratase|uniref:DJ-1/PfpI family protein n=1 Tax=Methylobacterium sp. ap11 TaxID=1761799 RepID=UPI0008AD3E9B|nr:DJ-1/PfpI family protein [Methylobacterium sp. ap11]SEP48166.1 cyclohexyl-isocyanide hydratase [Methylobacterium sp. ap11]